MTIRLAFDASCRRAGLAAPAWIHESDVRGDAGKKTPPNQRSRLYHRYEVDGRIVACRPDAVSRVLIDDPESAADAEPAAVVLAWEVDLSSEGRKQLRAAKPEAIEAWLRERTYREYWPETNHLPTAVRVAWVVPTAKRIEAITSMTERADVLAAYRFVTSDEVAGCDLAKDAVWRTASGGRVALYRPPSD